MNRRAFLAACGTVAIGGCQSGSGARTVGQVDCSLDGDSATSTQASAPETVEGAWPSSLYDAQNTGFNPVAAGPRACPAKLWQFRVSPDELKREMNYWVLTSPVLHDGMLYFCDNENTLYALDAATGSLDWTVGLRGLYIYGPTYADGRLLLTSNRHILAIDTKSQTEQWARVAPSPERDIEKDKQGWMSAAPAVHDGMVYAGTDNGVFCAFDAQSGDLTWYQQIPERRPSGGTTEANFHASNRVAGQPAIRNGVICVSNKNGRLYAFDPQSGDQQWVFDAGTRLDSAPTIHGDTVYVTGAGAIFAVSITDGTRKWVSQPDGFTKSSPAIARETVVAVAGKSLGNRNIVGLDASSGNLQWKTPANTSLSSDPVIAGETVVMGMVGGLLAVELASGAPLWSASSSPVPVAPVVVDDMIFAADDEGYVYALR